MKALLLKLLLLLLFVVLLFLVLRALEAFSWYETGLVISQIVDPLSLSVRKLKVLLDGRGISYDGLVEKQELTALIGASGDVMEGELLLLERENQEEAVQSTSFSSGPHFYEEVEDKKDSIWLIQVIPRGHVPLLDRDTWKTVVKKVFHFGIRTGTFDCARDNRFCRQKGWTHPILMLAMPEGLNQKDNVVMATYPSSNLKASKVIKWVSTRLGNTVHRVNEEKLVKEWLDASQTQMTTPPIKLVLLSDVEDVEAPLFFSAISLKYSGRVKFGQAVIHKSTRDWLSEELNIKPKSSHYLVATHEGIITYGMRDGEYLNHRAMDVYLGMLYPQANDFFMLSFLAGNMLCVLELVLNQGEVLAKRVCQFLWVWAKYNAVLIMMWLPLLALTQVPLLDPVFRFCQKVLRLLCQMTLASQLRCLWIMHGHRGSLIVASFFVFCVITGYAKSCWHSGDTTGGRMSSSEWLQSTAAYYYNMLVRPSPGYTRVLMSNARLEEGMNWDRILNQAMFPNMFLLADVSQDYLRDLPTWRYRQREIATEWSSTGKCCACWHSCFSGTEEHHQENCRLLQEYFRNQDKEHCESKMGGKYGKRCKRHLCTRCLCTLVREFKQGEPFLVTNSRENSDPSQKIGPNSPLQPQNIGSISIGTCSANLEAKTVLPNDESNSIEKSSHENTLPDDKASVESKGADVHVLSLMCDCEFALKKKTDLGLDVKSLYDPWPESMMETLECSICLEPYMPGVELCGLPCGHAFHQHCIMVWLTTNLNHCCPNCRWPAYKNKGSKLFKHKE
ncbi:E3 ubiquitin-protein ligase RNF103-like [Acanthaster planci]|uniref:E3 ubiquitin-protein ligase RNF103-like n=1 Tax=Acanthaster planci TaxID=133434 RepID=A0A8B7YMC6_ACAPL|nr:E3 ubiquitin-protein ligase RNF103-like [Acanthaster planci]XP_022094420.1 E3 ubiquitin-protein ligase RNF103-like [Acanthaster planci]